MINCTPVARSFLSERFPKGALHFQQITAADITAFVQRQATLVTSKRAPLVVTALRSFLRYLFLRGIVAIDFATCVPTIATWSLSKVPRFLAGGQIQKILASCDREIGIGKRDYALLLLLARLGLRAGEVVALTLDDLDWEAGLVVRGKGKRVVQMPLPSEVGAALPDHLSTGRPHCSSRICRPHSGAMVSVQRGYRAAPAGAVDVPGTRACRRYLLVPFRGTRTDGACYPPPGTQMGAHS